MSSASELIGEFVASAESVALVSTLGARVWQAVVDTVAVSMAARHSAVASAMRRHAGPGCAEARSTEWTSGARYSMEAAALLNGAICHALDYDDGSQVMRGHPSAVMLPAILALAESIRATGEDVVAAYGCGYEVMARMGPPILASHFARGWHSTATLGAIGSAVACSRLLELEPPAVADAIGLAVAQAAGSRQNFGTMAKPVQVGMSSAAGLRSARLAEAGISAGKESLDGVPGGFLSSYCDGEQEALDASLSQIGTEPFQLEQFGPGVKKYPACYATHRAIDAVLELRARDEIGLGDCDWVEVTTQPTGLAALVHDLPSDGLQAKFSMPYAVVAALADGHVALASFDDERVLRPEVHDRLRDVTCREDPTAARQGWTRVRVASGNRTLSIEKRDGVDGYTPDMTSDIAFADKVDDCLRFAGAPGSAAGIMALEPDWLSRPASDVLAAFLRP